MSHGRILLTLLVLLPGLGRAQLGHAGAGRAEELALIFRPFETDQVTLAPDGRHLAYTERAGETLLLVIRNLDANRLVRVPVGVARAAELSGAREKTPARLTFLQWATPERLVFNLNGRNVWSLKADGTGAKRLADPTDFQAPSLGRFNAVPRSVLTELNAVDRPVNVVALPRGGNYVYVEAPMPARHRLGTARVVLQLNVENGRIGEMGEAALFASALLVDQEGRPRISRVRTGQRSLHSEFIYTGPKGGRWTPLDDLPGGWRFHFDPANYLGERSLPLGFDYDPDLLYFASNVGRDTYGIYALDLKTQVRTAVAIETAAADFIDPTATNPQPLVFDPWRRALVGVRYTGAERATAWLDPELAEVQRTLKEALPGKIPEVLEWDDARQRFLVFAGSNTDPGVYYLFHRADRRLDEVLARAPWLPESARNQTLSFGFRTPAGVDLTGYLTLPRQPRLKRMPLVVLCHDGPWQRAQPGYNRWAQALASMGFAVVQVNYRGSGGFGRKHLDAARAHPDTVPLEDIMATLDWVIGTNRVDPKLVALVGEGYGGYLALRGMQLHPGRFRCAVTYNALSDLAVWVNAGSADGGRSQPGRNFTGELRRAFFGATPARLRAVSPLNQPGLIQGPVMLIQADTHTTGLGRQLSSELEKLGRAPVFLSLGQDEAADLPQARAALFLEIEGFLNENIYNYAVKLGETIEVK